MLYDPGSFGADIVGEPVFTDHVSGYDPMLTTDLAENFNGVHKTLIDNDVWVKSVLDTWSGKLPSGTRLLFAQPAAPAGWTQIIDAALNNRMLRLVTGAGGGSGGAHSPILMNVVPAHAHTGSGDTWAASVAHSHGVNFASGIQSANHVHHVSGNTGGHSVDHTHEFYSFIFNGPSIGAGAETYLAALHDPGDGAANTHKTTSGASVGHVHSVDLDTGWNNVDHTHWVGGATDTADAAHYHHYAFSTDNGSSATNWEPRYFDLILCEAN